MVDRKFAGAASGAMSGAGAGAMFGAPGIAVGAIGGGIAGYIMAGASEDADEDAKAALAEIAAKIEANWKLPEYDQTPLTAQEYKLLGTYNPQFAKEITEVAPTMVSEADSGAAKQSQLDALSQYGSLSKTGDDAISVASRENAAFEADSAAKSRRASLLKQYGERGLGGSGQEMLSDLVGGQQDNQAQRQGNLQAAADAQQRRLQALGQMGNMASQIRGDNFKTESANVSSINAFNQRNATNKQTYETNKANLANQAQLKNLEAAQDTHNRNVGAQNATAQFNKSRGDRLADGSANAANDKLRAQVGQMGAGAKLNQEIAGNNIAAQNGMFQSAIGAAGTYGAQQNADRDYNLKKQEHDFKYPNGKPGQTPPPQAPPEYSADNMFVDDTDAAERRRRGQ